MKVCPVAIAVGCQKCPALSICPLKSVIGDYKPDEPVAPERKATPSATPPKR